MISVVPSLVVFAIYLASHLPTCLVSALAGITFQIVLRQAFVLLVVSIIRRVTHIM